MSEAESNENTELELLARPPPPPLRALTLLLRLSESKLGLLREFGLVWARISFSLGVRGISGTDAPCLDLQRFIDGHCIKSDLLL